MSLITIPVFSFETCWQIPTSETENGAVKRLDYAYLRVFLEANTGLVSLSDFVVDCLAEVSMWLQSQ